MSVGLCCETYPTFFYAQSVIRACFVFGFYKSGFMVAETPTFWAHFGQQPCPTGASTVPKIRTNIVFYQYKNSPTTLLPPGFPFKSSMPR